MANLDTLIGMMLQKHAERALLVGDKPMHLVVNGQDSSGPILPTAGLNTALKEVVPEEFAFEFEHDGSFHFNYASPHGPIEIGIARNGLHLQASLVPGKAKAPPPNAPQTAASAPPKMAADADPQTYEIPADESGDVSFNGASASAPKAKPKSGIAPLNISGAPAGSKHIEHIDELFNLIFKIDASDLHLSSSETPMVRLQGVMRKLEDYEISHPDYLKKLLFDIAPARNREEWEDDKDTDFAYELPGIARFRCNFFADRHGIGAVFRLIPSEVLTVEQLKLPPVMTELCFLSKGLVVVTGPTGSGKSTTLAALIDHINKNREDHIITIEDPVEFVHHNINCLINQREVHVHTSGFKRALRAALREDPDIVLVGEMRDLETIAIAIETAETGHLVFGTLHTTTAPSTVDRIIDQFPADQQAQIRVMLSESLKGVIAQTLLRTKDGKRVAAHEILLVPTAVANLIREGKTFQLPSQMQIGKSIGMIMMNDSIMKFVLSGRVDPLEGYVKSVDKLGLLGSYEANGIDFEVPHG